MDKLTFLQAMSALAEGKQVTNDIYCDCVYTNDNGKIVCLDCDGVPTGDTITKQEIYSNWYIKEVNNEY